MKKKRYPHRWWVMVPPEMSEPYFRSCRQYGSSAGMPSQVPRSQHPFLEYDMSPVIHNKSRSIWVKHVYNTRVETLKESADRCFKPEALKSGRHIRGRSALARGVRGRIRGTSEVAPQKGLQSCRRLCCKLDKRFPRLERYAKLGYGYTSGQAPAKRKKGAKYDM